MTTKQVTLPIPPVGQKVELVRTLETDFARLLRGTRLTIKSTFMPMEPSKEDFILATIDKDQPSKAHQAAVDHYVKEHGPDAMLYDDPCWSWYGGHGRDTFSVGEELSAVAEFHMSVQYVSEKDWITPRNDRAQPKLEMESPGANSDFG